MVCKQGHGASDKIRDTRKLIYMKVHSQLIYETY